MKFCFNFTDDLGYGIEHYVAKRKKVDILVFILHHKRNRTIDLNRKDK